MGLFSIFQSKAAANPHTEDRGSDDEVLQARTRARRRLVGAGVLLLAGIIGFPLLFETQPRPIPVDIPIEIPRRDHAEPLATPSPREPAAAPAAVPAEPSLGAPKAAVHDEAAQTAQTPAPAATPPAATPPAAPAPRAKREPSAAPAPASPPARASADSEAARAQALLEGRSAKTPPAQARGERYVVQVGAFADASAAGEMRKKVEKLGLATYTQAVTTSAGQRIRVRVGPFASRDEAEKALAKTKAAGLSAVVLTL